MSVVNPDWMDLSVWAPPCVWQAGWLAQHCHRVVPVFSSRVFGVLGLLMISTSWCSTMAMYGCISGPEGVETRRNHGKKSVDCLLCDAVIKHTLGIFMKHSPICIEISPIAHVALLHTDINSGFKFVPSMGIKSAGRRKASQLSNWLTTYYQHIIKCFTVNSTVHTNAGFDVLETRLCQIPQQSKRTLTHFWHFVLNRPREQQKVNNASKHYQFIR